MLKAEILAQEGRTDSSLKLLREAVALEDGLNYGEPPDWFFSVRHNLGAVLLQAKRYAEAEAVFTDDLKTFPRNGWALAGLHKAQVNQGFTDKAQQTQVLLNQAWKWADKEIKTKTMGEL